MANVNFGKRPVAFQPMAEGIQTLLITAISGIPRANITSVEAEFVNADGKKLKNTYDLTNDGGYAAFYYLVSNGLEVELDGEFDIDQLVGAYVEADIVHREGKRPMANGELPVFANIKAILGPGTPFQSDDENSTTDVDDDWS